MIKKKVLSAAAAAVFSVNLVATGFLFDFNKPIIASAEVEILTVEETSEATNDSPDVRPDASSPSDLPKNTGTDVYRDGTYTVPVYMYSALQNDDGTKMSMANGALKHEAVVNVTDGSASITLGFNAITLDMGSQGEIIGHLLNLWYYDQNTHLQDTEKTFDYYYPDANDLTNFE